MSRELLRFVAAHGLAGDRTPPPPITSSSVESVLVEVRGEKLIGLLDQGVADGAVEADRAASDRIAEEAVGAQGWTLMAERHHLDVHAALAEAGIEHRFLKGPTVAHRFYEHPALRPFIDVDVLVRGSEIDRTVDLISALGHTRIDEKLTRDFDARYGKSVTLRSLNGVEVDVHRVLASGPFGLVAGPDPLWDLSEDAVVLGGRSIPTLDHAGALVHACVHAVTGRRARLGSVRDVAQIAALADHLTMSRAAELAGQLGVVGCVGRAASLAATTLSVGPGPVQDLAAWPVSRRDARWLDVYATRTSYAQLARASLTAVSGLGQKLRFFAVLARARRQHRHNAARRG